MVELLSVVNGKSDGQRKRHGNCDEQNPADISFEAVLARHVKDIVRQKGKIVVFAG
jgi:hypothetical protein